VIPARAIENTVFLVYVNLVGRQEGLTFWGGSRALNPFGDIVAMCKYFEEDVVVCELDLGEVKTAKQRRPTLADTRAHIFQKNYQYVSAAQ
jgi:predicted amidohydrolase